MTNTTDFSTHFLKRTTSTMDAAKQIAAGLKTSSLVCVMSETQTEGRGRGGSTWVQGGKQTSEATTEKHLHQEETAQIFRNLELALAESRDFYPVTFIVPSKRIAISLEWISAAVGCAFLDALDQLTQFLQSSFPELPFKRRSDKLCIKWPNDIVSVGDGRGTRKLCGILIETAALGNTLQNLYIGVGLNLFSAPTLDVATSYWNWVLDFERLSKSEQKSAQRWLASDANRRAALTRFGALLQKELLEYLCVERTDRQLRDLTLERSLPLGTVLSVNKGTQIGRFEGLTEKAALILDGNREPIISGTVETFDSAKKAAASQAAAVPQPEQSAAKPLSPVLALDLGNTRLHWGFEHTAFVNGDIDYIAFENEKDLHKALLPLLPHLNSLRRGKILLPFVSVCDRSQTERVVATLTKFLNRVLPDLSLEPRHTTSREILERIGLKDAYAEGQMGPDRALRFFFAKDYLQRHKKACAVFSFGTATTCEALAQDGSIAESLIAPGLQMSLSALAEKTAKLPHIQWNENEIQPDEQWNTEISLQRGVLVQTLGMVKSVIETKKIDKVFFCGGNADSVEPYLKNEKINAEKVYAIETQALIRYARNMSVPSPSPLPPRPATISSIENAGGSAREAEPNSFEDEEKLPDDNGEPRAQAQVPNWLLKTMEKARFKRQVAGVRAPSFDDFRRIGGRIENIDVGMRFDRFLAKHYPFLTRNLWRERIELGEVCIQHNSPKEPHIKVKQFTAVKHTYRTKPFDQIWLYHPPELEPESTCSCDVVYDNGDIVAFSKPGNLVIHASGLYVRNTFISVAKKMGYGDASPVHRIDRETSGLLLCARRYDTRQNLSLAFRNTEMRKMYLAVTRGTRELPERFRAPLPIGDAVESRIRLKMWVNTPNALPACTDFVKLSTHEDHTLFACLPRTGRTNQIRIHLAALGHWIVGDKMYHPNEDVFIDYYENGLTEWGEKQLQFPRHILHNAAISYKGDKLSLEPIVCPVSPDLYTYGPAAILLEKAGIPTDASAQTETLLTLFNKLSAIDFASLPALSD